MIVAVLHPEKAVRPAAFVPPTARQPAGPVRTFGMLVGRADLSDEAVLTALGERLSFEGRDPAHAPGVLKAALAGKPLALTLLRKLVLPPPQSALTMPVQQILREPKPQGSSSWLRRMSFGR